jgi:tetrathionate reductase subunit A
MTENTKKDTQAGTTLDRRQFISSSAATIAATGLVVSRDAEAKDNQKIPETHYGRTAVQTDEDARVVHSVCLGCNARCGNRQVVKNGRLEKISGNPYHPYNSMGTPIDYNTPVKSSLHLSSPVCGKAHDAIGYVYNERRLTKPLKRDGARGEGKFVEISWEQLIREITEGGRLFSHLGESRDVPGLQTCLSEDLIDPKDATLGTRHNGFSLLTGRLQSGRQEFIDRFVKSGFGSINRIGHTDICGLGFRMGNYALTEGKEVELKADPWGAKYILVFGANIYEALQPGINTYGAAVADRYAKGKVKFTIVDPRAQNAAVHSHDWVPIIPGQDGAFAMGMIRWMIENKRCNTAYLTLANLEAAKKNGYSCYSNATHLVIDSPDHSRYGQFLRLADLKNSPVEEDSDVYMVMDDGFNPLAFTATENALLEGETTVHTENGKAISVTTSFTLMKRAVFVHTLGEYSQFCGISEEQIVGTARDFTSYGTKAAVCQYHGAGNYANGTYAAFAVAMLSVLVGSIGMKGGYLNSGGAAASWKKGDYDLNDFPGKKKPSGVKISREQGKYEETAEFAAKKSKDGTGYPAQRPWFSFTKGGLSVEAMSGIDEMYPYGCKVLFTYFYNPVYSTPGGNRYVKTLKNNDKVPLHVSIDIGINESNIYADYIVPDVTYLEGHYGWLNPHAPALKFTGVRVPCLEPLTGRTKDNKPFCLETLLIDLALALQLPGFGENAIPGKDGIMHPLKTAEDFYLRAYVNIAQGAKVPQASSEDVSFVEKNYPLASNRSMFSTEEWGQLCHMLARGGVFTGYDTVFSGESFLHGIERVVLYNEKLAKTRNSLTGTRFSGTLQYQTPENSSGQSIAELDRDYPFTVVTFKMHVHTQSRTTWHRYAMELFPENYIQVNTLDAKAFKLRDGDTVSLRSASNPEGITGKVAVTQLIRPGCVGISFHYGHSQLGTTPVQVVGAKDVFLGGSKVYDGTTLSGLPALGAGTNPNMVGRLDSNMTDTPLVDVLAGIPDFSSTRVTIEKSV